MMEQWKALWYAGLARFGKKDERTVKLSASQLAAFIELQANYALRRKELAEQFPDTAFPIRQLGEDGSDWEWFPANSRACDLSDDEMQALIRRDVASFSNHYVVTSNEEGVPFSEAYIQLVAPGIRRKKDKTALVKAKITLVGKRSPSELDSLMSELEHI
jgi:hypothetical protein